MSGVPATGGVATRGRATCRSLAGPVLVGGGAVHPGRVRPVDRLLAAYNGLLSLAWLAAGLSGRGPAWLPAAVAAHAAAAFLPRWLARDGAEPGTAGRLARDLYPLLALAAFFEELGRLLPLLHDGTGDAAVRALDAAVFGGHPHAAWMPAMPWVWLSESMFSLYFIYYALIFVPPIVLAIRGRREAVADTTFRLMATYLACYTVYLVFPVVGPHLGTEPYVGALTGGFFYRLVHFLHARGDAPGTAFPSSHVAGAVAIALACRRWLPGAWSRGTALLAVGVAAATIYTRNHYAIDVAAGLVLVAAVHAALPALRRLLGGEPQAAREPWADLPLLPPRGAS